MTTKELEFHVGHFGDGTGAANLIDEVKYARKFIKRIYDIAVANGVPATFYEDKISKNKTNNVNHLIAHHNKDRDGLIVSGHLNASAGTKTESIGVETLYYNEEKLAKEVTDAICKVSGMKNRGAKKRTDIGVLARTYEPGILIEFGFVNSKKDVELMDKHFEEICFAVAQVLAKRIGYTIKDKVTVVNPPKTETKLEAKIQVEFLTATGKAECKEAIRRGVKEKLFKEDHKDMETYNDVQLISYAMAYFNRKTRGV